MISRSEAKYKLNLLLKTGRKVLERSSRVLLFVVSLGTLLLLVYEFGFQRNISDQESITHLYDNILQIFLLLFCIRIAISPQALKQERGFWFELILFIGLLVTVVSVSLPPGKALLPPIVELILRYILLIIISIIQVSKNIVSTLQRYIKPEMMFVYSFLILSLIGTFLLMLPKSHQGELGFIDALFTATSSVCITGLVGIDISSTLTLTGQIILISLVQIGGIGVMTFTSFFAMSFFEHISFRDQIAVKDMLAANSLNSVFRTLMYILLTTFIVEFFGALIIYQQISDTSAQLIPNKIFFSVFHSISAFCNAGFSTLSGNLYDPSIRHLYGLQGIIALLVILGGIGFPIVFNLGRLLRYHVKNGINRIKGFPVYFERKLHIVNLTTRIAILSSLTLIVAGSVLFYFFEYDNILKGMPVTEKLATSFFAAVTPRSAGFNNIDMDAILSPTLYMTIILMWIGASPTSTGGGIKTTTFMVAVLNVINTIKGKERVEIAKRRISPGTVNKANTIILLSLMWTSMATIAITVLEPHISMNKIIFEVFSAYSTTGLSLNLTSSLSDSSKILLTITMFVGRIGLLTLLIGITKQKSAQLYAYPDEEVIL